VNTEIERECTARCSVAEILYRFRYFLQEVLNEQHAVLNDYINRGIMRSLEVRYVKIISQ